MRRVERVLLAAGRERSAERLGELYQRELARDHRRRRAAGAFYTPAHLVDLTCSAALDPLLATADDPGALRIIDPAAGAGVFLTGALERIARASGAPRAEIARRCLAGVDIDPDAVALCRIAVASAAGIDPADLEASIRCADALADDIGGGYDAVIGNPPWGQKATRFSEVQRAALRDRYLTAAGVLDPFKLFVERAHQLARPGGRWAMVLPDIILLKNQEAVRALILERSRLSLIAHAGRAFDGVNLDAVVIAGELGRPDADTEVEIWREVPETWRSAPVASFRRRQSVFANLPRKKLNLFASDADLERVESLRGLPRFGDRFEIHEGVHTGNSRAKLFLDAPRVPCAKLIRGGAELRRGAIRWGGGYIALDPDALDRDAGDYANLGRLEWHARKKIAVRRTGDRVVAAFDDRGYWFSNNAFVAMPRRPMSDRELAAHTALLNSALITWYFRTVQPRVGRLFAELKIHHLAEFPVPELDHRSIDRLAAGQAGEAEIEALFERSGSK
jgi:tRNA1(Val) A37 N6-methylase TrmN6